MPTLAPSMRNLSEEDRHLIEAVNRAINSAFHRGTPPSIETMRENIPQVISLVRRAIEIGEITEEQGEMIIRTYVGVITEREISANVKNFVHLPEPEGRSRSGFIANWVMKHQRAG